MENAFMPKFLNRLLYIFLCLYFSACGHINAKTMPVVKATVNDKVITTLDLTNKAKIFLKISKVGIAEENKADFKKRILESAIDDSIKLETVKKFEKQYTGGRPLTSEKEIKDYLNDFLVTNKCNMGDFFKYLEENKIPISVVYDQIEANLSWVKYIQEMFGHFVQVSEREIDDFLENIKISMKSKIYNLSRIVVSVDVHNPSKSKKKIDEILLYLRNGAEFSAIAQNFSETPEGIRGGYIGSVNERQLSKQEKTLLNGKNVGTITDPILVRNSYIIYKINDISEAGDNGCTKLHLQRIEFTNVKPEEMEYKAQEVVQSAERDINSFLINAQMDPFVKIHKDEVIVVEQAAPEVRSFLSGLIVGKISQPIPLQNGFFVFFLKDKKKIAALIPSRNEIRNVIANRKLQSISMQQLEEERKNSLIKVR